MSNTKDTPIDYKQICPPEWYNESQIYHWLIRENYSEQIAKELSAKWADDLQGAFNKGFEKGTKENTSLKLELQKQKELNAELVKALNAVSNSFHTSNLKYIDWMPTKELNESMRLLEVLLNKVNNP